MNKFRKPNDDKFQNLISILKDNVDKDGIINNITKVGEKAGYKNRSVYGTLKLLVEEGILEKIGHGRYKMVQEGNGAQEKDPVARELSEIQFDEPDELLVLTPDEKVLFDRLEKIRLNRVRNGEERFNEDCLKLQKTERNTWKSLLTKLKDLGILKECAKVPQGIIFGMDVVRFLEFSEQLVVMEDPGKVIESFNKYIKRFEDLEKGLEKIKVKLGKIDDKIKKLNSEKKELNEKLTQLKEELEKIPRENIDKLDERIRMLKIIEKLSVSEQVSFLKEVNLLAIS